MTEPTGERSRRISITKLQRQTAAGAELISLCQTITEDGRLSDEEVNALRQWVDDHASIDLPARDFLLETIRRIIEDGKVSDEERAELYQAIEKVLPPDIRADVRGKPWEIEEAAEAVQRQQREAQAQVERDAKRRNRPISERGRSIARSGAAPHRRSHQGPHRRANTNPRRAGANFQRRRPGRRSRS